MRKLSRSMVDALRLVAQGPIDDMISLINLGDRRAVTLKALERRGLCAWHPYGQDSRGNRTRGIVAHHESRTCAPGRSRSRRVSRCAPGADRSDRGRASRRPHTDGARMMDEPTPPNAPYTIRYLTRRRGRRVWIVVARSTDLESVIDSAESETERRAAGTIGVFDRGRKVWPRVSRS